ncbi:HTTM domain-containing protein [Rhodocytophaga aerolata]|uniref:HTTM domain-containing protein n=1 Tax=Rhodocytophaga aerolata TaxID=455078 RepID=A0ABT8R1S9_9BACT|nr:HTTM domain-containing protein [Rhodocytophaga aerolata]MDO1446042.1 HTTM domain-containing protein [Rhodocytophaga aerolata]
MMKKVLLGWLLCIVGVPMLYLFAGRELMLEAIEGKAPAWFNQILETFYPRFAIEKHRFDTHFFLSKADQVVIRFSLVQMFLLVFTSAYIFKLPFRNQVNAFWDTPVSVRQVHWLRVLFYLGMLFFTYDWFYYLDLVRPAEIFYKPLLLLRILNIDFPSVPVSGIVFGLLMLSYAGVIFWVKPVSCSIISTLLFVLMQGWLYSFEKIDHTFSTLTYAALIMPFLVYEQQKAFRAASPQQAAWPLQLIRVCIAMVYVMAGLEKLLIAGTEWFNPESFRSYLFLHQAPAGLWVAQSDVLCTILPFGAMLFQLGFCSILFFRRLTPFVLLAGIGFHAGTYILLEVGWYFNAWIFVYIFFIDWTWLDPYLPNRQTRATLTDGFQ